MTPRERRRVMVARREKRTHDACKQLDFGLTDTQEEKYGRQLNKQRARKPRVTRAEFAEIDK